jgi:hypothetical protein
LRECFFIGPRIRKQEATMMEDIDIILEAMRGAASDARLGAMEDSVLGKASARRARTHGQKNLVMAGLLALGAGVFANVTLPQGAEAEPAYSFNAAPEIAPSNLLLGAR